MSYILDALRRADAERERGSVPGIHAQPAMLGDADSDAPQRSRPWLWPTLGFGLVLLALPLWWFLGNDSPRPGATPVAAAPIPVSALPPPPRGVAPVPAAVPAPALAPAPAPLPAPTTLADAPRKPAPKVALAAAARPPAAASKPPARAVVAAAAVPAPAEPRIYQLSELPDEIRRELPTLAVGGAMYSQNPANRLLIVKRQTFHEGDKLAPNLSLEQIRLKSAVLEYKGYRYGITY